MFAMKTVRELTLVGLEIDKQQKRLKWTLRRLSEESGVPHPTISRLKYGVHTPTPETLSAIGNSLGVDPTHLMRLAGIPIPAPQKDRHPTAEYISQRLDQLPAWLQEHAIDAVAGVVDQFLKVAAGLPANGNGNALSIRQGIRTGSPLTLEEAEELQRCLVDYIQRQKETPAMADKKDDTIAQRLMDLINRAVNKSTEVAENTIRSTEQKQQQQKISFQEST